MSAELLRRGADRARELAEAADDSAGWTFSPGRDGMEGDPGSPALIAHIELWSPTVALAVADWLDYIADLGEEWGDLPEGARLHPNTGYAVAVARALLREAT